VSSRNAGKHWFLLHLDAEMSLWEILEKQSLFACMFKRTGVVVHMSAYSLVHFTCILRRQPCKEITSALVVLLYYNKEPAAGELSPLLVCLPSDQTRSLFQCSFSLLHPHSSNGFRCPTPQLSYCSWILGEKGEVMQMLYRWWWDAGFGWGEGFCPAACNVCVSQWRAWVPVLLAAM